MTDRVWSSICLSRSPPLANATIVTANADFGLVCYSTPRAVRQHLTDAFGVIRSSTLFCTVVYTMSPHMQRRSNLDEQEARLELEKLEEMRRRAREEEDGERRRLEEEVAKHKVRKHARQHTQRKLFCQRLGHHHLKPKLSTRGLMCHDVYL